MCILMEPKGDNVTDTPQPTRAQNVGAILFLAVIGYAIYMAVTDHWQWAILIPLGAAFVFGVIKFGWDAATAVNKKAND